MFVGIVSPSQAHALEAALRCEAEAEALVALGHTDAASDLFDRALCQRIRTLGPGHESLAPAAEVLTRTSNHAANLELRQPGHDLRRAERRLQRTLALLAEVSVGVGATGSGRQAALAPCFNLTLSNLAALHQRLGNREDALVCLQEAESLCRVLPASDAAATHLSLCALLSQLGRHTEAERYAAEAARLGEVDILQLASLQQQPGDPHGAAAGAAVLREKVSALAVAYNNLAVQREFLGQTCECLVLYEKAVVLAEGHMEPDNPLLARLRESHRNAMQTAARRRESCAVPTTRRPSPVQPQSGRQPGANVARRSGRDDASREAEARNFVAGSDAQAAGQRDTASFTSVSKELAVLLRKSGPGGEPEGLTDELDVAQLHRRPAKRGATGRQRAVSCEPLPQHMRAALAQMEVATDPRRQVAPRRQRSVGQPITADTGATSGERTEPEARSSVPPRGRSERLSKTPNSTIATTVCESTGTLRSIGALDAMMDPDRPLRRALADPPTGPPELRLPRLGGGVGAPSLTLPTLGAAAEGITATAALPPLVGRPTVAPVAIAPEHTAHGGGSSACSSCAARARVLEAPAARPAGTLAAALGSLEPASPLPAPREALGPQGRSAARLSVEPVPFKQRSSAARRIQRAWQRCRSHQTLERALLLQRVLRAWAERAKFQRSLTAASKLTVAIRVWLERKRQIHRAEKREHACARVQRTWRRHRQWQSGRKRRAIQRQDAAVLLKCRARTFIACLALEEAAAQHRLETRQVAVFQLMRSCRSHLARAALQKAALADRAQREREALQLLGRCIRSELARATVRKAAVLRDQQRVQAAEVLQRQFRAYSVRVARAAATSCDHGEVASRQPDCRLQPECRLQEPTSGAPAAECPPWRCRFCDFLNEVSPEMCVLCDGQRHGREPNGPPNGLNGHAPAPAALVFPRPRVHCCGELRVGELRAGLGRPPSALPSVRRRLRAE